MNLEILLTSWLSFPLMGKKLLIFLSDCIKPKPNQDVVYAKIRNDGKDKVILVVAIVSEIDSKIVVFKDLRVSSLIFLN